jgi:hypothetical protein
LTVLKKISGCEGRLGKLSKNLSEAHFAMDSITRASNAVRELRDIRRIGILMLNDFVYVSYAISRYCSIFNSSDEREKGVGKLQPGDLFADENRLSMHREIMAYRNREVAHLTEWHTEQEIIYDESDRSAIVWGRRLAPFSTEHFTGNSEKFDSFTEHIEATAAGIKMRIDNLQASIRKTFEKLPPPLYQSLESVDSRHLPSLDRNTAAKSWFKNNFGREAETDDELHLVQLVTVAPFLAQPYNEHVNTINEMIKKIPVSENAQDEPENS